MAPALPTNIRVGQCLKCKGKAKPHRGFSYEGRLLALLANNKLRWKSLKVANTLAYHGKELNILVGRFMV